MKSANTAITKDSTAITKDSTAITKDSTSIPVPDKDTDENQRALIPHR